MRSSTGVSQPPSRSSSVLCTTLLRLTVRSYPPQHDAQGTRKLHGRGRSYRASPPMACSRCRRVHSSTNHPAHTHHHARMQSTRAMRDAMHTCACLSLLLPTDTDIIPTPSRSTERDPSAHVPRITSIHACICALSVLWSYARRRRCSSKPLLIPQLDASWYDHHCRAVERLLCMKTRPIDLP